MKPVVDGLRQRYDGKVDFVVYADLNADRDGGELANGHGVSAVPTMMLVDPSGTEISRWVGAVPADTLAGAFDEAVR